MFCNSFLLVLLAFFQPALSMLDLDNALNNVNERCLKEAGIKRADFIRYVKKPSLVDMFEGNRSCYVLCIGKEQKKIRDDGRIDVEAILKDVVDKSHKAQYRPALTKCAKEQGANPCETTKKNIECIIKTVMEMIHHSQPEDTDKGI